MNTLVMRAALPRRLLSTPWEPLWLVVAASVWIATVGNAALWRELRGLPVGQGASAPLLGLAMAVGIAALLCMLLTLLAWRWTLKPVLATTLVVSAACSHFMLSYNVVIDPSMMVNVLQTDAHEAFDLLSPRLAVHMLLFGVLPAWWVLRRPLVQSHWTRQLRRNLLTAAGALLVAVLAVVAAFQPLASTMRNHRHVRYLISPLNAVYATVRAATASPRATEPVAPVGTDAQLGPRFDKARPPLVVLVLGETGRAGNFGINGYARDTTPRLAAKGVATFTDVWSCGTSTAASVPCMFSQRGRDAWVRDEPREEGLLDVLQHAGLAVLWVDNQGGCKGVCDRVPSGAPDPSALPALCPAGECFDEALLAGLDERIAALPEERRARGVVVVLHQMGSHGPAYHRRSPPQAKRFLPECRSNDLQDCSRTELVNAYDNSIAYTDQVLGDTIGWLQAREDRWTPAMVYVADHGESLGENNLYLHGLPYAMAPDVQKRVPWVTWFSAAYQRHGGVDLACLRRQAALRRTHDDYFHSVLGLLDVQTAVYQTARDAYAPCRNAPAQVSATSSSISR